jgi:HD-GYP domain-containing protein (c-di-GMP phosphodiesterase class II)
MKNSDSHFVDIKQLRIGLFVELDVGWMSHPFPSGSFKISSQKQIDTIRGLGLQRVRYVPSKSDAPAESNLPDTAQISNPQAVASAEAEALVQARRIEEQKLLALRKRKLELVHAEHQSLAACERRFAESGRQYRKVMELVHSQPAVVARQCESMVDGFVTEMLAQGETAIRLLSETGGDRAALHPVNVMVVSMLLGKSMGMKVDELTDLGVAAFLHDIGKLELPDRVRLPEDNFTTAELKLYQDHVAFGVKIVRPMGLSNAALLAIAQHHEFADGTGFPARIKGDAMTMGAKVLALVNRYDNLCNPSRPATAMTPHESLSLIYSQQKSRFDAAALSAFIRMMGVYPPGSVVQLVDDRYASVVSVNSSRPLKPRVIVYETGVPKHETLILDLERAPNISIRRSLKPSTLPAPAMDYLAPRQRISYFFERVADVDQTTVCT